MKKFMRIFVFTLLLASGLCQSPTDTTTPPTTQETTTEATTTSTSPDTTTVPPTTSTAPPPTTTSTPKQTTTPQTTTPPTTTPPTTTPPTTTPTTPKTTTPVVTTTPGPITTTPVPPTPEMGEWNVTDGNVTCIRADLTLRFKIPVGDSFEYLALSPNATVGDDSNCNSTNGTQVLHIVDSNYELYMVFDKDGNSRTYVSEIRLVYRLSTSVAGDVSTNAPQFSVSSGFSYVCNTGTVDLQNVTMEVMHVQLQSFGAVSNLAFGTTEECEADNKVNDLVPIVVGCVLLALVVIVLIAYFVGRRRSRQKGYTSV